MLRAGGGGKQRRKRQTSCSLDIISEVFTHLGKDAFSTVLVYIFPFFFFLSSLIPFYLDNILKGSKQVALLPCLFGRSNQFILKVSLLLNLPFAFSIY